METWASFKVGKERINGMVHLPETPKPASGFPAVVMLHGWTGSRSSDHRLFVLLSRFLMRLGIASLRFDFRGSGESEGGYEEMTLSREVEDALEGMAYLRDLPEIDPHKLSLLGFSMGGLVAALASPSANPFKLLMMAPALPEGMLRHLPGGQIPPGIQDFGGWPVGREFWLEMPRVRPLEQIAKFVGPVRYFYGDKDDAVSLEHVEKYRAVTGGDLVLIHGVGHTFDSLEGVETLYAQIGRFLLDTDAK